MLIRAMPRSARFFRRRCATVSRIVTSSVGRTEPDSKVSAAHGTVLQAKYSVKVQAGPAVIALRDVAHQAEDLALFVDIDRLVFLGREIEPTDLGFRKGSDGRYRSAVDALLFGKVDDGLEGFLALVEDQNEHALGAACNGFRFHVNLM